MHLKLFLLVFIKGFVIKCSLTSPPYTITRIEQLESSVGEINHELENLKSLYSQNYNDRQRNDSTSNDIAIIENFPGNCKEALEQGQRVSGIYKIRPAQSSTAFFVRCNMVTRGGGWTYLINRFDGSQDFYLNWENYKNGFGDLNGEFWLGLEKIHVLTGYEYNELLVELVDWNNTQADALYDIFRITGENEGYALHVEGFTGDAGDSLNYSNGMKFTTKDKDQDEWDANNCATDAEAAWWYKACTRSHLTGKYLGKNFDMSQKLKGLFWWKWHGFEHSLKQVRMMVRSWRPYTNPLL